MEISGRIWGWLSCVVALSAQAVYAQPPSPACSVPLKVGNVPVANVLQRLRAKLEPGSEAKELDAYSSHFDRLDTNLDGKYTKREYVDKGGYMTPQARAGIFRAADGNADGVVTKSEVFERFDRNKDGKLQKKEIPEFAQQFLLPADADGDDMVTREELQASRQRRRPGDRPAGDWPQFHGPNRDNRSTDRGLLKIWPEGGPLRLWEASGIGEGYSTVAIVGKRIYTTGAIDGDCVITALDMDGKEVWTRTNGKAWKGSYPGTRSTPTITDGLLYHLSGIGNLICLKADSGKVVWTVNILERFSGRNITWGLAESPLVIGDTVICTPGGKNISMVALDRRTGEVAWQCTGAGDKPGYASPILIDYQGLKQIATVMSESVVGVRAADGTLLWRYPHRVYADENITMPLFHDGFVIVSGCVRKGTTSLRLQVSGDKCSVKEHWHNGTLDNKQGGIVLVSGRLYGYAETQSRSEPWMCIDFESGETIFQSAPVKSSYKYKNGCLTYADGMFYLLSDDGNMALAKPTDAGFEVTGRLRIEEPGKRPTWAHPVVHGGRLYIRYGNKLGVFNVSRGVAEKQN